MAATTDFKVFLELARRAQVDDGTARAVNRIPLFVREIQVSTQKTVPTLPIPFAAVATGASETLAFDMGISTKTLSLSGVLLDQTISKDTQEGGSSSRKDRILSCFELAQLIHSYVDSSQAQEDQNLNKLIILIPSRVDTNFDYHDGTTETKDLDQLPLIPFTFDNRRYDERFKRQINQQIENLTGVSDLVSLTAVSAFTDISDLDEIPGMSGFIQSFDTTFSGEQPNSVEFSLNFEVATVIADNPVNNL
tara:strand:- start:599 stop:1348 length:750 start_codon:yes stop_codon:yes gene_type:complete